MNVARLSTCFAASLVLTLAAAPSRAQQPASYIEFAACGTTEANYTIKHAPGSSNPAQPPTGKALVYIIENISNTASFVTKKVNIGLDGAWIGATDAETHISFIVDPGGHHLWAAYQSRSEERDAEGRVLLLHLNAQAGHIYYLRYHALLLNGTAIAFFEPVDEDEGLFQVQSTDQATSTLKK